jgi:exosome complex RNA-binding protein Rrp4
VLEALGKSLSFEIAVGLNGRVWVGYNVDAFVLN